MKEDIFRQLERSHRRLEQRIDELRGEVHATTIDVELLDEVVEFFERAVRRHEADEERSLFPRIDHDVALRPILLELTDEHQRHEVLHGRLRAAVAELHRTVDPNTREALSQAADALADAYDAHIRREEQDLFPAARAALADADVPAILDEMTSRRQGRR